MKEKREDMVKEFADFGNGHAEYMVKNIDMEEFIKFVESKDAEDLFKELDKTLLPDERYLLTAVEENHLNIGDVHEEDGMLHFATCERYAPYFSLVLSKYFPEATVYACGEWDENLLFVAKNGKDFSLEDKNKRIFDVKLSECFVDEGLRVDLEIIDKETNVSFYLGQQFYCDSEEDFKEIELSIEEGSKGNIDAVTNYNELVEYAYLCPELKTFVEENKIFEELKETFKEEEEEL